MAGMWSDGEGHGPRVLKHNRPEEGCEEQETTLTVSLCAEVSPRLRCFLH